LSWLRTVILLISASRVAEITGVSYWCPAHPLPGFKYYSVAKDFQVYVTVPDLIDGYLTHIENSLFGISLLKLLRQHVQK
jgi:hypothetical protein